MCTGHLSHSVKKLNPAGLGLGWQRGGEGAARAGFEQSGGAMSNAGWNSGPNSPAESFSASGSVESTPNTSLDGGRVASGETGARAKGSQQGGSPSR